MTINTKQVTDRRKLSFSTMDDILADAEALDGKSIRTTGNWSAAQIVAHVTTLITFSLDGTDIRAPLVFRVFGKLMKGRVLSKGLPVGIANRGVFRKVEPEPAVSWDEALGKLRHEVARIHAGARMDKPSPVMGTMTHDDWVRFHCRHAELHFSFMHPGGGAAG
jgi:hypothetical protein